MSFFYRYSSGSNWIPFYYRMSIMMILRIQSRHNRLRRTKLESGMVVTLKAFQRS